MSSAVQALKSFIKHTIVCYGALTALNAFLLLVLFFFTLHSNISAYLEVYKELQSTLNIRYIHITLRNKLNNMMDIHTTVLTLQLIVSHDFNNVFLAVAFS